MTQGYHSISELPISTLAGETVANLDQYLSQTIGFTQELHRHLPKALSQTIGFAQTVVTKVIRRQNLNQTIGFTHEAEASNTNKRLVQNVNLTQDVVANTERLRELAQEIRFTDSVVVNGVYNIEVCDCIEFGQKVQRTKSEELEDTITFQQSVDNGSLNQTIGFTDSVVTNAVQGGCCRDYEFYIPNKLLKQKITFTQSVVAALNGNPELVQSLNLKQTVAYILVEV